jgi:hypothetical protein
LFENSFSGETMMKLFTRLLAAALAGLLLLGTAWAGSMDARFGNTVVATYPDGTTLKFYYNADKTFAAKTEKGGALLAETTGTWRVDADKLCLTAKTNFGPFEGGKERCIPLMGDKVGDSWPSKAQDSGGQVIDITVAIVAGR